MASRSDKNLKYKKIEHDKNRALGSCSLSNNSIIKRSCDSLSLLCDCEKLEMAFAKKYHNLLFLLDVKNWVWDKITCMDINHSRILCLGCVR